MSESTYATTIEQRLAEVAAATVGTEYGRAAAARMRAKNDLLRQKLANEPKTRKARLRHQRQPQGMLAMFGAGATFVLVAFLTPEIGLVPTLIIGAVLFAAFIGFSFWANPGRRPQVVVAWLSLFVLTGCTMLVQLL